MTICSFLLIKLLMNLNYNIIEFNKAQLVYKLYIVIINCNV